MKKVPEKLPYIINYPSELVGLTIEDMVHYLRRLKEQNDAIIDYLNQKESEKI